MQDKRTRIFVDAHCFDAEYQGSRTFVKEIYGELLQKKDLLFFLAAYDTERLKSIFPPAENLVYLKYKWRSPLPRLSIDIPRLIRKHHIDLAHFQYITPLVKNCAQLVTIHDVIFCDHPREFSWSYRFAKQWLYRRSARTADHLTTVSEHSKIAIRKYLQKESRATYVIPNGVRKNYFENYDKSYCKDLLRRRYGLDRFILYVSRIEPRKNHAMAVKAFVDLQLYRRGFHLVFLGHITHDAAWRSAMAQLPAEAASHVFHSDAVSDEELLCFYRAADLFVYPSKAEGFGIPPLEAAAARVPVLCSNSSAMKEYAFFGEGHIDPDDADGFRKKLEAAISQPACTEQLNRIAETVRENYSWKRAAEQLYQLIINN